MVFVIDKSLIAIIFVYAMSFSLIGAQFTIADVFHITLRNIQGQEIKSNLVSITNLARFNSLEQNANITAQNQALVVANSIGAAAGVAWDLLLLITGTYVFYIMYLFNVPIPFVVAFISLYVILVIRSIMGWIRGI